MAVDYSRKKLMRPKHSIHLDYSKVSEVIDELKRALDDYGPSAEIRTYSEPYSDSEYYYIYAEELETDAEMKKRIKYEEQYEQIREEQDRREYERLQAKYNRAPGRKK